jgi:type IV secretory pathway VirB4 component
LPVAASWTGDGRPVNLLHNARGNLVGLDPFASYLPNPNAFIAGTAGSGKSSLTNYLFLNHVAAGGRAIIIDIGGSYRRAIEIVGGQYIALQVDGAGRDHSAINPFFDHADIVLPNGALDGQRLQLLQAVIERMLVEHDRPALRQDERAIVTRAVEETYRRTSTTPILSDFVEALRALTCDDPEDREIVRTMIRGLRNWITGANAPFINRPSTVQLTDATRCAACDLKGVESMPDLQAVLLLCLSALIWNVVMRDRTEPKLIVFDEVWRLLSSPASADLIAALYRTTRKYKATVLTLSQSAEDFTGSAIATALLNNSSTVYLLKHERGHADIAREFHLNERELAIFQSLEKRRGHYTEALVFRGAHHFRARIVLTPLEYWIATTDPADLALERQMRAKNPNLSRLKLLQKLAHRYPHGAPSNNAPEAHVA